MKKTLYQIINLQSGRRLLYKHFDIFVWSEGNGEDGTFFEEKNIDFVIKNAKLFLYGEQCGPHGIVKYEIDVLTEWPEKKPLEEKTIIKNHTPSDLEQPF